VPFPKIYGVEELSVGQAVTNPTGEELLRCPVRKCGRFL
jgi:hypothetical protein